MNAEEDENELCFPHPLDTPYGDPFSEYSLSLSTGWHMLGALSTRSTPETDSEAALSVIFGFKNGTYMEVNEMKPTMGYWINVIEDCMITLK